MEIKDSPVKITDSALNELKQIQKGEDIPESHKLRIGVKSGGCSGFSYVLGFDEVTDKDLHFKKGNLEIIIDKDHTMYLAGMEIDWLNDLSNRGFIFNNPNAKESCGCGTSFSA